MRNLARLGVTLLVAAGAFSAGMLPARAAVPVYVENPTFNMPVQSPGVYAYTRYAQGSTAIPGWQVTSGSVEVYGPDLANTGNGMQSLELNGASPGAVEQAVNTARGATYNVYFRVARDSWTGAWPCDRVAVDQILYVQVDGDPNSKRFVTVTAPLGTWTPVSYWFTATRNQTRLQFGSLTSDPSRAHCGPQLTDVEVDQVS